MFTKSKGSTYIRNSSFYLTDAVATEPFINDARFHNNLYLATNYAKAHGLNVQNNAKDCGLMPYQYEYDKSLKKSVRTKTLVQRQITPKSVKE